MTITSSPRLTVAVTMSPALSKLPTAPEALVMAKLVTAGKTASSVMVLLATVTTLLPSVAVAVMVLAPALMTSLLAALGWVAVKVPPLLKPLMRVLRTVADPPVEAASSWAEFMPDKSLIEL